MKLTAIDTETHLIEPGNLTPRLVCLSWCNEIFESGLVGRDQAVAFAERLLSDPDSHIGGANISFDLGVLENEAPHLRPLILAKLEAGRVWDTHILEALDGIAKGTLSPKGYSLAGLELKYLGRDRSASKGPDAWRMRYAELDGIPLEQWPEEARQYPIDDAEGTFMVLDKQLGIKGGLGLTENRQRHPYEMRAAYALHRMAINGLRTDPEQVARVSAEIRSKHAEGRLRFSGRFVRLVRAGRTQTPDSIGVGRGGKPRPLRFAEDRKALQEAVQKAYRAAPPITPKGRISTSHDTLVNSGDPELEDYASLGANSKLLAAFVPVLEMGTKGPINPRYNILVKSGRSSCRRPNLQQLPRVGGIRECFVPPAGHYFISVDYASLEFATLAQVCIRWGFRSHIADAINQGKDLHLAFAASLLSLSYEDANHRLSAGDVRVKAARQMAKAANYGLMGLMGPPKLVKSARREGVRFCELAGLSQRCGDNKRTSVYFNTVIGPTCTVCIKVAKHLKKRFFQQWPEVRQYHARVKRLVKEGVLVSESPGAMHRLEGRASAAANHFFQNLAAAGAKQACWDVERLSPWLRPCVFAHDEIIAATPVGRAAELAERMAAVMVSAMQQHTPDVTIRCEPVLLERWYKDGKSTRDNQGVLIPWQPTKTI